MSIISPQWSERCLVMCNIMTEGFRFIYPALGLVRLRTFRLAHGLVRCKLERRCWRDRGEDVSFTDVKIKSQIGSVTRGYEWRHAPEAYAEYFGRFEKSQLVEFLAQKKTVDFRGRTCWRGADGKVSIERLCLSPYVEKPFNSKELKSFVPELRSRKCFSCFGIPMLSICVMDIMNVLRTGMNMSISRIPVWLCYKCVGQG